MSREWTIPTRATELEAQVREHLSKIFGADQPRGPDGRYIDAEPIDEDGGAPRERCSTCSRVRPVFELVDVRPLPQVPGDWACGACRERMFRQGLVSQAEIAQAHGAPAELLEKFRNSRAYGSNSR